MRVKRERSKREALLTVAEKQLLLSGEINAKARAKLYAKLDRRFKALMEDMDFLTISPSLALWRDVQKNVYNSELWNLQRKLEAFMAGYKTVYPDRIMHKKGPKGEHLFWIKTYSVYSDKIYNPGNLTTSLKRARFRAKLIADLVEAHRQKLIPRKEDHAISEQGVMRELENYHAKQQKPEAELGSEYQELVLPYKQGLRQIQQHHIEAANKYHQEYNKVLKQKCVAQSIDELLAKYEKKEKGGTAALR